MMIEEDFGKKFDPIVGLMALFRPSFYVCSPDVLEEIYITKNKSFDKDPGIAFVMSPLLGTSTLVSVSNEKWAHKRKAVSSAFYKSRLLQMTETVKEIMDQTIKTWE